VLEVLGIARVYLGGFATPDPRNPKKHFCIFGIPKVLQGPRTFENAKNQKRYSRVAKPPGYSSISNTSPEIIELRGYAKRYREVCVGSPEAFQHFLQIP
jgi:hypothetical protein